MYQLCSIRWLRFVFVGLIVCFVFPAIFVTRAQDNVQLGDAPSTPSHELESSSFPSQTPPNLVVDTSNRTEVIQFYNQYYRMLEYPLISWTGSIANCNQGDTTTAFKDATLQRVNFFRAMAGLSGDIQFIQEYSAKAQAAAMLMSANNALSHGPPNTWTCYNAEAAQGAASSNLVLGANGWQGIDLYIADHGANNMAVGHRRWILHPPTKLMGTGNIPNHSTYRATNALWVFDSNVFGAHPPLREATGLIAWPPRGYIPSHLVYPRWSFGLHNADFSSATISMQDAQGQPISLNVLPLTTSGSVNTIVWEPNIPSSLIGFSKPSTDYAIDTTINNVLVNGVPQSFSYRTILIAVNGAPDWIYLQSDLAENAPAGTQAARFYAFDPEGQAVTYSLVSGAGDTDNHRFRIQADKLLTLAPLNYEAQPSYRIRVRVSDGSSTGTLTQQLSLTIKDVNDPPHNISATDHAINENMPAGTLAATLIAHDQDANDSHSFQLVSGSGDTDNSLFRVQGDKLLTNVPLDYESKSAYSVRVRVSDREGKTFTKAISVSIKDANDPPNLNTQALYRILRNRSFRFEFQPYDQDRDAQLSVSVSNLPTWVKFEALSGGRFALYGNSAGQDKQTFSVVVTLKDQHNATTTKNLQFDVADPIVYLPFVRR